MFLLYRGYITKEKDMSILSLVQKAGLFALLSLMAFSAKLEKALAKESDISLNSSNFSTSSNTPGFTKGAFDDSPLDHALRNRDYEIVKLLIEAEDCSAFQNLLSDLISEKTCFNARNRFGETALHIAVNKGMLGITELLIKKGANINARNNIGNTPLHYAVKNRDPRITALLIAKGADVNARGHKEKTPLYYAMEKGNHPVIIDLLSQAVADIK